MEKDKLREELENILYAPNLNITQKEYKEFIDEVVPKVFKIMQERDEEIVKAIEELVPNHTGGRLKLVEDLKALIRKK